MKFRKKPIVIDAERFTEENMDALCRFVDCNYTVRWEMGENIYFDIPTSEGAMTASLGDWIIKGAFGEFYPCKPHIFAETYEQAE